MSSSKDVCKTDTNVYSIKLKIKSKWKEKNRIILHKMYKSDCPLSSKIDHLDSSRLQVLSDHLSQTNGELPLILKYN